jgi:hypothetical protein
MIHFPIKSLIYQIDQQMIKCHIILLAETSMIATQQNIFHHQNSNGFMQSRLTRLQIIKANWSMTLNKWTTYGFSTMFANRRPAQKTNARCYHA